MAIAGLAPGPPGQLLVLSSAGVVYSAPASSPSNITRVATLPLDKHSTRIPFTFDGSVLYPHPRMWARRGDGGVPARVPQ